MKMRPITFPKNLAAGVIILFIFTFSVPSLQGGDATRGLPVAPDPFPFALSAEEGDIPGGCVDGAPAKIKMEPRIWLIAWEDLLPEVEDDVLCYIGNLPAGYSVSEIDVGSILLNGTVPITEDSDTLLPNYPGFVDSVLRVGFNKREAILSLGLGGKDSSPAYRVIVEGLLPDGSSFCGSTCIKVKGPKPDHFEAMAKTNHSTPQNFELSQNHPNPFNPETEISYYLPVDAHVNLSIYNILGQKVKTLVDGFETAGWKNSRWDGRDEKGIEITSGVYFYKICAGGFVEIKKMIMLK